MIKRYPAGTRAHGRGRRLRVAPAVAALATVAVAAVAAACGGEEAEPLRIGVLADFSGPVAYAGPMYERGVELAARDVNAAGGVGGRDVVYVTGDTAADPQQAVREARRLIDEEGVHVIVGASTSQVTLTVAETVSAGGIPTITPTASSPLLAGADDGGYLFRAIGSAGLQARALAGLAAREGIKSVGVMVRDDAWGRGYLAAFEAAYGGDIAVAFYGTGGQPSYLDELRRAAAGGARHLLAISFPPETAVFVAEAVEGGLFGDFLFTDGSKSLALVEQVGAEHLEGARGTAAGTDSASPEAANWDRAWADAFGGAPAPGSDEEAYIVEARAAYDAAVALALAAEAAGSLDGAAIRDHLPAVAGPPGRAVAAGTAGVRAALEAIRDGGDVDYTGAVTSLDWNAAGDVSEGLVEIWEFRDGGIVTAELIQVQDTG